MVFLLSLWGIMGLLCLFSFGNLKLICHGLNHFSQSGPINHQDFAQLGIIFSVDNSIYFYRAGRIFKCF